MDIPDSCRDKDPRELETIKRFIEFYSRFRGTQLELIDCDVKTDDGSKDFDFFLLDSQRGLKIGVECTQLVETDRIVGDQKHTSEIFDAISHRLAELDIETGDLYIVSMPSVLPGRYKVEEFTYAVVEEVKKIIDDLVVGEPKDISVEGVDFEVRREEPTVRDENEPNGRAYVFGIGGGSVPGPTFPERLEKAFKEKDQQLANSEVDLRILLITNFFILGGDARVTYETVFTLNPLAFPNIDEVYFEISKDSHIPIYSREVFRLFDSGIIPMDIPAELTALVQEYLPVYFKNDRDKSFAAITDYLKSGVPHELIQRREIREEVVRFDDWLKEQGRFEDLLKIIEMFIDDPDPGDPADYEGDPRFNYHQQILEGEDVHLITSVAGTVAWALRLLALREDYIHKALLLTEKLFAHKNLYVRLQTMFPLIEIAVRRQWLDGYGERPYTGEYRRFRDLVFKQLEFLENNQQCIAIGKLLCHVLGNFRDLSAEEVGRSITVLGRYEEFVPSLIYFALFRRRHFGNLGEFDSTGPNEELNTLIREPDVEHVPLIRNIAWQVWRIIEEHPEEIVTVTPLVNGLLNWPYDRTLCGHLQRIILGVANTDREFAAELYLKFLMYIDDIFMTKQQVEEVSGVWLMETEEIIEALAGTDPSILFEIFGMLDRLLGKRIYIGDLSKILTVIQAQYSEDVFLKIQDMLKKDGKNTDGEG